MTTTLIPRTPTSTASPDGFINGEQLKARMDLILDVARHVMVENIDFGKIPGCDKPSLWKPGAEKLCVAFRVAAAEPTVEDLSTSDEIRYRVQVPGLSQMNGATLGVGIGECSTSEKKYKWRYPVHKNEFEATPVDRRREVFKRDGTTYQQVRTDPADLANTVLKMAHKRAMVGMALVVTGASAIFSQDLEDLPEEMRETVGEGESRKRPERASTSGQAKPKPTVEGQMVSDACLIKSVTEKEIEGKDGKPPSVIFWVETSDGQRYSLFDKKDAAELKSFAGTAHQVRITYVVVVKGSKSYRNFVSVAIVEGAGAATTAAAPTAATSQPSAPAAPEMTDSDFGDFRGQ